MCMVNVTCIHVCVLFSTHTPTHTVLPGIWFPLVSKTLPSLLGIKPRLQSNGTLGSIWWLLYPILRNTSEQSIPSYCCVPSAVALSLLPYETHNISRYKNTATQLTNLECIDFQFDPTHSTIPIIRWHHLYWTAKEPHLPWLDLIIKCRSCLPTVTSQCVCVCVCVCLVGITMYCTVSCYCTLSLTGLSWLFLSSVQLIFFVVLVVLLNTQ